MELKRKNDLTRRDFMYSVSGILAGVYFRSHLNNLSTPFAQEKQLLEGLSGQEVEIVKKSSMAEEFTDYYGKGYSCAESMLMVTLNHLNLSDKYIWAACGFGGGIGKGDLCGLLTGGIMGLGFAAGELGEERSEAKMKCSGMVDQYWRWWLSQAPLKCKDIRTPGTSSKVCVRLGKLAAAKVQNLIAEMREK